MPSLHRYALATLIVALPLVAAQGPPGDRAQGQTDPSQPPAGAPEGASGNQGDETMAKYPEWYSNDYNCGTYTSPLNSES